MARTLDRSLSYQTIPNPSKHPYVYMDEATISTLLICSVCEKPFIDPVTAGDQQRGCRSCFTANEGPFTDITEWIVMEMLNSLLVQCVQCGEINIRRDALEKHDQTACRRAMVRCEASDIKCAWKGTREQRDRHEVECIFKPLRPALSDIITENKELRERIEQLERTVEGLKQQE